MSKDKNRFSSLPTETLEGQLQWYAVSGEADGETLAGITAELRSRDKSFEAPDTEAALRELFEIYLGREQPGPAPEAEPLRRRRHMRAATLLAAVLALLLLLSGVCLAADIDPFKAVARWSSEVFRLELASPSGAEEGLEPVAGGFDSIGEALASRGLSAHADPGWAPEGYSGYSARLYVVDGKTRVYAGWDSDGALSVSAVEFGSDAAGGTWYQKDDQPVEEYPVRGIVYYIFSKGGTNCAVWYENGLECCISGPVTRGELRQMIDSLA